MKLLVALTPNQIAELIRVASLHQSSIGRAGALTGAVDALNRPVRVSDGRWAKLRDENLSLFCPSANGTKEGRL